MSTISGAVKVQSTIVETLPDNASRTKAVPVDLGINEVTAYTDGTTAGKCNRVYYEEFVANATPKVINLSTCVCNDGSIGIPYVRDSIVANDDTVDGHDLTHGGGTTPFGGDLGGTSPTQLIRAGTAKRLHSKPLGTTGIAVGANVNFRLDPGAFSVAGKVEILGHS